MNNYNRGFLYFICAVSAMGGLLFGYDWVVIGGAKPFYELYFGISESPLLQGVAMSTALVGCLIGAMVAGAAADKYGRKPLLIVAAVLFTLSAIATGLFNDFTLFNIARFIGGMGIGVTSALSPMYIAEVSPTEIRGRMVSLNQMTIVLGILAAQVVNMLLARNTSLASEQAWNLEWGWRWMFWAETVPAALFLVMSFFIPESPVFLKLREESGKIKNEELRIKSSCVPMVASQQSWSDDYTQGGNILQQSNHNSSFLTLNYLYNPQMRSAYNFVPAIMGMLLMLICAMMTSISIVREKERGTMEVLLVSPVRPLMVIIAKAVPYLVLAFAILITILLMARFVLGVPLQGSLFWILAVSTLYILLALSLGLLISSVAQTQLVALLLSAMVLLMPVVMLSGMLFPVESMPTILQWISAIVPPRYYIEAMRKLMIMGVGIGDVAREVAVLSGMTIVLLAIALKKFNVRLE